MSTAPKDLNTSGETVESQNMNKQMVINTLKILAILAALGLFTIYVGFPVIGGFYGANLATQIPAQKVEELVQSISLQDRQLYFNFDDVEYDITFSLLESSSRYDILVVHLVGLTRHHINQDTDRFLLEMQEADIQTVMAAAGNSSQLYALGEKQSYGDLLELEYLKQLIRQNIEELREKNPDGTIRLSLVVESLAAVHAIKLLNDPGFQKLLEELNTEVDIVVLNSPLIDLGEASGGRLDRMGAIGKFVNSVGIRDAILWHGTIFANRMTGQDLFAVNPYQLPIISIAQQVMMHVCEGDQTVGSVGALEYAARYADDQLSLLLSNDPSHPCTQTNEAFYEQWLDAFIKALLQEETDKANEEDANITALRKITGAILQNAGALVNGAPLFISHEAKQLAIRFRNQTLDFQSLSRSVEG